MSADPATSGDSGVLDLDAIRERAEKATPGPWNVWDGHGYLGGGRDLCIGAGEEWLANMQHRRCVNVDKHYESYAEAADAACTPEKTADVCELDGDITAEQDANAQFIAHSREDVPALIREVERLRSEIHQLREAHKYG